MRAAQSVSSPAGVIAGALGTLALVSGAVLGAGGLVGGCGPSVPTFPTYERDAGLECGDEESGLEPCPTGQVCLQGTCYVACSETRPCGPREECSSAGVCTSIADRDAGPPRDSGPPDPCLTVRCAPDAPFCRGGACLACMGEDECGGGTPVCDWGRGVCTAFDAGACAPCNDDLDCDASTTGMTCVSRTAPGATERVCAPPCGMDGSCPSGLACEAATGRCLPALASCTSWRAGATGRACSADADCFPAGAPTDAVYVGACFDSGAGFPTCHHPCGTAADCPNGQACNVTGFCQ
jgi:hypothetical protein